MRTTIMSGWDTAANYANTVLGAACTFGSALPGVGGLLFDVASGVSGATSTATSTNDLDKGINLAGTVGSVASLPAVIAGLAGVGTGIEIGGAAGLSTIAGAGGGLGASAAASGTLATAAGAASVGGSVLGAGAAGYGLGSLAAEAIDVGNATMFGKDEAGKARDSFDVASDAGHWLERSLGGGTAAEVAGGALAGIASIPLAIPGIIGAAAHGIGSLFD